MKNWPENIIEAVARRRAIVILGAGSSFHSTPLAGSKHPPDWPTFLGQAADRLMVAPKIEAKRLIKAGEYLSACEIVKSHLLGDWTLCVEAAFGDQRLEPGDLHTKVYELDLPIVMTTNFDKVYQSAAAKLSASTVKVKTYRDRDLAILARGSAKSRVLLKAHGSIDDIGSMIFTRSDYIGLRNEFPLYQKVIASLAVTNTLIFIGCGLRDPDMILMLEDLASVSKGFGQHFCLIDSKQSQELEKVYKDCFGLSCIRYKHDKSHSELPILVGSLSDAVKLRRSEMASSALW
ncbi:SIR2 family protein [Methylobacterium sp. E-041]|uniref:SIR2 family protein n=1 Tax=Methylobacterium sp. E-041 TaxID=2836573 RepID=UPI001FBB0514|nr:SIR2 family protein [Methylobacterium sp. E-041]MCJ2106368.1 SIR2 family protein [Methylobacterium sp. E-041]